MSDETQGWTFVDDQGTFRLHDPDKTSYLYFPLVNQAGMMSAITPTGNGDVKAGQDSFLTLPVSVEDLHNARSARNFWVYVQGYGPWSAIGNSAGQIARRFADADDEAVTLEAGFLWHQVRRESQRLGLRAEVINFVPSSQDRVELMAIKLTNIGQDPLHLMPTAAIPIFGRSADNLRDHRHVSSLLHRVVCHQHGILVRPTLSFDERGHLPNTTTYAVLGADAAGQPPMGFFPTVEDFIGEGGTLDWPQAVARDLPSTHGAGEGVDGYEALGGLRFSPVTLQPGDSQSYLLILGILAEEDSPEALLAAYGNQERLDAWLQHTRAHWRERLDALGFYTADARFDGWMRWVAVQPTLRRLFGNSFLPYHDYGRGGRGWRDLWQDVLSLLIMESADVGDSLASYFAGVRIDGSNATIIGSQPGDFRADRNNIPRVWMDHGAWPLQTVRLYIDQTGDLGFLLRKQSYFQDHLSHRCQRVDRSWQPGQGTLLRTSSGDPYLGTVLEHLLVQHLTAFFNVGAFGNTIRLEGADWNDGLDMAVKRGESVAFTALYAWNLSQLSELVRALARLGVAEVELAAELGLLLDTLDSPVDYSSATAKQQRLACYFDQVPGTISGQTIRLPLNDLARDLDAKASWLARHLRTQEWIENAEAYGWFNGYYDDDGQRVEGDHPLGARMTLTGQVFALMGGIATDEQAREMVRAADRYLWDEDLGGYRLNTDFGEVPLNLGRAFGFAFGHKENGAMFSHMAVMFANALYRRGLVAEGWRVLAGIYRQSQDFAISRMYPGIPEYFSARGRGMYPYLTGSASWFLLTMVQECFGVRGRLGNLQLVPRLMPQQFNTAGQAALTTLFASRRLEVVYHNLERLAPGEYAIGEILLNGKVWQAATAEPVLSTLLPRNAIADLPMEGTHRLDLWLVRRQGLVTDATLPSPPHHR